MATIPPVGYQQSAVPVARPDAAFLPPSAPTLGASQSTNRLSHYHLIRNGQSVREFDSTGVLKEMSPQRKEMVNEMLDGRLRDWREDVRNDHPKGSVQDRLQRQLQASRAQQDAEKEKQFQYHPCDSGVVENVIGGARVGIAGLQGHRKSMEDAHCALEFTINTSRGSYPVQLYGVFDGHSGQDVARCVATHLPQYLQKALCEKNPDGLSDEGIWNALKESLVRLNNDLPELSPTPGAPPLGEEAMWQGTCVSCAMILDGKLWTMNVGDSRIAVENNGPPMQMTEDAKSSDPKYQKQILKRGGFIIELKSDTSRVNNDLAVPRAIGDHRLWGAISPRPKITMAPLSWFDPKAQFVICCDGVFDVASTNQVCGAAFAHRDDRSAGQLAMDIADSAYGSGSQDNISCIVVRPELQIRDAKAVAAAAAGPVPAAAGYVPPAAAALQSVGMCSVQGCKNPALGMYTVSDEQEMQRDKTPEGIARRIHFSPNCSAHTEAAVPPAPAAEAAPARSVVTAAITAARQAPRCMLPGCDKPAGPNPAAKGPNKYWRCCSPDHAAILRQQELARGTAAAAAPAPVAAAAQPGNVPPAPGAQQPPKGLTSKVTGALKWLFG